MARDLDPTPGNFPDWATTLSDPADIEEPDSSRKQIGYHPAPIKPARKWYNWIQRRVSEWLHWCHDSVVYLATNYLRINPATPDSGETYLETEAWAIPFGGGNSIRARAKVQGATIVNGATLEGDNIITKRIYGDVTAGTIRCCEARGLVSGEIQGFRAINTPAMLINVTWDSNSMSWVADLQSLMPNISITAMTEATPGILEIEFSDMIFAGRTVWIFAAGRSSAAADACFITAFHSLSEITLRTKVIDHTNTIHNATAPCNIAIYMTGE